MQLLLFSVILVVVLRSSLSVSPGDPFPTVKSKHKNNGPGESFDPIDMEGPNDQMPSPSKPLDDSMDPTDDVEVPSDDIKSSSTQPIPLPDDHDDHVHVNEPSSSLKPSGLPAKKSISKENLIKIDRWKFVSDQTDQLRYWYEPEGGHMGTGWTFDQVAFVGYSKQESGTEPVYAFHTETRGIWSNTLQMDPRPPIIGGDQWISDGISFYAYKTSMESNELRSVWRYWNKLEPGATDATETRTTFLTINKSQNNEDLPGWTLDDILFYVLPPFEG